MRITLLDASVLVSHLIRGAHHERVGYEDADVPLEKLRKELNKVVSFEKRDIESALWSCTLLKEEGEFSHPDGITLDTFIKRLTPLGEQFNPLYGVWEKTEDSINKGYSG